MDFFKSKPISSNFKKSELLDDMLYWSRITYKNNLLKALNIFSILIIIFDCLIYFWGMIKFNDDDFIIKFTPGVAIKLYTLCSLYFHYQSEYHMAFIPKILKELELKEVASDKIIKKVFLRANLINKITKILIIVGPVGGLMFAPWMGDEKEVYIIVKFLSYYQVPDWIFTLDTVFLYFYFIHIGLTLITSGFRISYFVENAMYHIMYLNDFFGQLLTLHENFVSENLIKHEEYQRQVNEILKKTVNRHARIVDGFEISNQKTYYVYLLSTLCGIILFSSLSFFIYSNVVPTSNFRMVIVLIMGVIVVLFFSFFGQNFTNESENLYTIISLCPFYLWNKDNRQIAAIFLLNASKLMQLKANDIVVINCNLVVRLSQKIFTMVTFLISIIK